MQHIRTDQEDRCRCDNRCDDQHSIAHIGLFAAGFQCRKACDRHSVFVKEHGELFCQKADDRRNAECDTHCDQQNRNDLADDIRDQEAGDQTCCDHACTHDRALA